MTLQNNTRGAERFRLAHALWVATLAAGMLCTTLLAAPAQAQDPTPTAQYTVRFDGVWSPATHPIQFPPGPHFSPLVGATHQLDQRFWQEGTRASHGIKRMAEEGRSGPLANEVRTAMSAGSADQVLEGGGIARSPGTRNLSFEVDEDFPAVTLVSMIAPSPDWFVGVSALSLRENGDWVTEKVVPLFAYDAGTDSGSSFLSPNTPSLPTEPVRRIQGGSLGNGEFLGTFTFTRTDAPPPPALALQEGRFRIRVQWEKENGETGFGRGTALTSDSGTFWFFDSANVELIVKVIDACAQFDRFWFFAAGLTNVGVEIEVEDTEAGEIRRWENPVGRAFVAVQNTTEFATCP